MGSLVERRREMGSYTTKISTIRINQNLTDPAQIISGDVNGDVIQAIRRNSHIYLGKYLGEENGVGNMAICQLDDNDSNYYANGELADLTGVEGDLFMGLPRFYTKAVEVEPDIWDISFAYGKKPDDDWMKWGGDDLIGVYKGIVSKSKLYSWSNRITTSSSQKTYKTYAQARGNGYSLVKLKHCNIMAFLFFALYGNTNSQAICGKGLSLYGDTISMDYLGMNDTNADNTYTRVKFWGLVDWWGFRGEWVDNVTCSGDIVSVAEDDNSTRTLSPIPLKNGYIKKIQIGNYLDIIPSELGASATTTYCDYFGGSTTNPEVIMIRTSYGDSTENGVTYSNLTSLATTALTNWGTRLCFRGRLIKQPNPTIFKSIPIIN